TVAESGGFSYWARYELALPLLDKSRAEGFVVGPAAVNTVSYRFPDSKVKLEATIIPSMNVYDNGDVTSGLYLSPRLYYLVSDSFWIMGIVESGFGSQRGG